MSIILQSIATTKHFHGCKAASTNERNSVDCAHQKKFCRFISLTFYFALSCVLPCTILDSQFPFFLGVCASFTTLPYVAFILPYLPCILFYCMGCLQHVQRLSAQPHNCRICGRHSLCDSPRPMHCLEQGSKKQLEAQARNKPWVPKSPTRCNWFQLFLKTLKAFKMQPAIQYSLEHLQLVGMCRLEETHHFEPVGTIEKAGIKRHSCQCLQMISQSLGYGQTVI